MRIAASDYDGTINIGGELCGDVIAAIWKWREDGNRFGLATGRDLRMTLHETDCWSIPFDFLICLNGAVIYDSGRNLLQVRRIDNDMIPKLLEHPAGLASMHYQLLGEDPIRLFARGETWFQTLGMPYEEVDYGTALATRDVGQISLAYIGPEECREWTKRLRADFGERVAIHSNGSILDINPKGVDKASGIADLLALMEWEGREVLAIGDGCNDLEMIRRYRGYTVPNAIPEIKAAARAVCADVAEMLNKA